MKTQHIKQKTRKFSLAHLNQHGFFSIGFGLGLATLFAAVSTLIVTNNDLNNKSDFIPENNSTRQIVESEADS